jgi:hypothetical protein
LEKSKFEIKNFQNLPAGELWTQCGKLKFPQSSEMKNADFTHWIIYARCVHSGFPQAVNKHSAEIAESKEKISKSSKIQLGSVTQKVL